MQNGNEYARITEALQYIPADDRDTWLKMGMAVKAELGDGGFDAWDAWSQGADSYRATDARDVWRSIDPAGGIGVGTLFYEAKANGWRDSHPAPIDPVKQAQRQAQRKADQAKADQAKAKANETTATKAKAEWATANAADPAHPYLVAKGTRHHNLRQSGEMLLVPLYDESGALWNLQRINPKGEKFCMKGGRVSGAFCPVGDFSTVRTLLICEGWATGATLHEATGHPTLCAMNDGNLKAVALAARSRWPDAALVICADNDRFTAGNPGMTKATDAAKAVGAALAVPQFPEGIQGTDFNDLAAQQAGGLETVKAQIEAQNQQEKQQAKQEKQQAKQEKQQAKQGKQQEKQQANSRLNHEKPLIINDSSRTAAAAGHFLKKTFSADFDKPIENFPHVTDTGRKRATIANLRRLFEGYGITVAYDEVLKKQSIQFNNPTDTGHGDLIDNAGLAHIRSLMALNGLPSSTFDLLPALFADKATNPVLDWIESRPWDRKDRLRALADTLTVATHDKHYRDLSLLTWLVQCIAAADGAARTPNEHAVPKYELAFILQGGQGARKTSWFKRLLPRELGAYIVDGAHLDPADKETVRTCISAWICELGELDSTFRRADISRLKAFLSKQTDTIRLPYDRAESQFKRRTSFCGSVNPEQFLNDNTGARRFLPLQVTACDSLHTLDMQQVWAQVFALYMAGHQWWCTPELEDMLKERHERHAETTPIDELITEIFKTEKPEKGLAHRHYTATRILIECGIKEPKAQQASIANTYLKKLGFRQVQTTEGVRGFWLERRKP